MFVVLLLVMILLFISVVMFEMLHRESITNGYEKKICEDYLNCSKLLDLSTSTTKPLKLVNENTYENCVTVKLSSRALSAKQLNSILKCCHLIQLDTDGNVKKTKLNILKDMLSEYEVTFIDKHELFEDCSIHCDLSFYPKLREKIKCKSIIIDRLCGWFGPYQRKTIGMFLMLSETDAHHD